MNKRILKIINSLIGLSVLAMFTVAIVAGQARANFKHAAQLEVDMLRSTSTNITLRLEDVRNLEAIPIIVETMLDLPIHLTIEIK